MRMTVDYKPLIEEALSRVYRVAVRTSLDLAPQISAQTGNQVSLKREDRQAVFAYKVRGAYNMMAALGERLRDAGVITASAGNHAQGVALAARQLAIPALIVMPKTTPEIKINAVRRYDADVVLHGNTYDEAQEHALKLAAAEQREFIPPYDHPLIIAGQATVGVEILQQSAVAPDCIFVPIGGGGLMSGIAVHVKAVNPGVRLIGVEPAEAASMLAAFKAGRPVALERIGIFADGAAVREVGTETYRLCRQYVDDILVADNDEICAAVKDMFEDTRTVPEPAGALAIAGLKKYVAQHGLRDRNLVAVFSGANVNFDRLRHIAELAALGEQREALLSVRIPERPGSFQALCHDLGARQITEFNYRYADANEAHVFAGVQVRHGVAEKEALIAALRDKGYQVTDMSGNELAKMHVRYMVGGHAPQAADEVLYRFEFPERSGALLRFLNLMGGRWNISLFHYRNHGAAYGRVLMGIQVPPAERGEFGKFLATLDIPYYEERDNPAYAMYLR
jgi:threonine dehydratase